MSGIFLRSDEDSLVTSVSQANGILQELCSAYIMWNSLIIFSTDTKERKASNEMDCISPEQELKN